MKKIYKYCVVIFCVLFACLSMTACDNSISKDDYEKLTNEYNELFEEKEELKKISEWIEIYRLIEIGKHFNEISAMFDFEYANQSGSTYPSSDDNETNVMRAYIWKNNDVFDIYHTAENQIVVVFLNDVSIYKQYGNQQMVFDYGTVRFPFPLSKV